MTGYLDGVFLVQTRVDHFPSGIWSESNRQSVVG